MVDSEYPWTTTRVFISSTFRDFHAERDYLIKYVFPELRQWCERYRINLIDIDLRWGVTRQEAENGKVLDICLGEIDHSRPFFIGMLGNRYGWIPEPGLLSETIRGSFGSMVNNSSISVTHMEIDYGVLSGGNDHAFFYFRNPDTLPKANAIVGFSDLERRRYQETFFDDDNVESTKLETLKREISSASPHGDNVFQYSPEFDPELANFEDDKLRGRFTSRSLSDFGARVRDDLISALKSYHSERIAFIQSHDANTQDMESSLQESFVEAKINGFAGRKELLSSLHRYVREDTGEVLAIFGEPGSGKSSLLARFYRNLKETEKGSAVLPAFAGAGPLSASLPDILKRLCREIQDTENNSKALPVEYEDLMIRFRDLIEDTKTPLIILVDGLDQLAPPAYHNRYEWIPEHLPEHVSIIVSAGGKLSEKALASRTERLLHIGPLPLEEQEEIIREIPSVFAKSIDREQIDLLVSKTDDRGHYPASSPLYIRLAMDELRIFGAFDRIGEFIAQMPADPIGMFVSIISRLEAESDTVIVARLFCLIECSRFGLTGTELQNLMGDIDPERRHLAVLRQFRTYLLYQGEKISFFHHSLSAAVRRKYFQSEPESESRCRIILMDFFRSQNCYLDTAAKSAPNTRRCEELIWQELHAGCWTEASEDLRDLFFLQACALSGYISDVDDNFGLYFALAPKEDHSRELLFLHRLIRQEKYAIALHPEITVQQLWNRMKWDRGVFGESAVAGIERVRATGQSYFSQYREPKDIPRVASEIQIIWKSRISCVSADDRGELLAIGSDNGKVSVLELPDFRIRNEFNLGDEIESCAWSHDSRRIAIGTPFNVRVFDAVTGDVEHEVKTFRNVYDVAWSPDDRLLFVGSTITGNAIGFLYALDSEEKIPLEKGGNNTGRWGRWSRDGSTLWRTGTAYLDEFAISGIDAKLERSSLVAHTKFHSLSISPDDRFLALAGEDGTVRILDRSDLSVRHVLHGHRSDVAYCGWMDTRSLLDCGADKTIRIWDTESQESTELVGHSWTAIYAMPGADDGTVLSVGLDRTIRLWDTSITESDYSWKLHDRSVRRCLWSPDGRLIASAGDDGILSIMDDAGRPIRNIRVCGHRLPCFAWSPDSRRLVVGGMDGSLSFVSLDGGISPLKGHARGVWDCCWSPGKKRIASVSEDLRLSLWHATNGKLIHTVKISDPVIRRICWIGDTKILLASKHELLVYHVKKDTIEPLLEHDFPISAVDVDIRSKRIFFGDSCGSIVSVSLAKPEVRTILDAHTDCINDISLSGDGEHLTSCSDDRSLKLWRTGEKVPLNTFCSDGFFMAGNLAPNSPRIVCGDNSGNIFLLEVKNGESV